MRAIQTPPFVANLLCPSKVKVRCAVLISQHLLTRKIGKFLQVSQKNRTNKAELLQEGIFYLIHFFARDILVMKNLEIEKTKPTFMISVLKCDLSFFDFQLFH